MDNQHATEILRLFEEFRQAVDSKEDKRWRWRDGTLLFPEGRCCYCGQPVRSNRLWVIEGDWLRGQLRLDEGKAVFERPEHPHSGTDGVLCTGGHDVLTALFFGINPRDVIRRGMDIRGWYKRMFGHVCNAEGQLKAAEGIFTPNIARRPDRRPNCGCGCGCNPDAGRCGCDCDRCYCDYFECVICEERHSRDYCRTPEGAWDDWCTDCYDETYINCDYCGAEQNREVLYEATEQVRFCAAHVRPEQRGLTALADTGAPVGIPLTTATAIGWNTETLPAFVEMGQNLVQAQAPPQLDAVHTRLRELRERRTARMQRRGDGTYTMRIERVPAAEAQERLTAEPPGLNPPVEEAGRHIITMDDIDAAIRHLHREPDDVDF